MRQILNFAKGGNWLARCVAMVYVTLACPVQAADPPTITGPIAGNAPGSPDHNYIFQSTADVYNLAGNGYVEQEFFMSGTAATYPNVGSATNHTGAIPAPTGIASGSVPYKTDLVVYRPVDPARFNGTVVLEWNNVSNGYNAYFHWFQLHQFFMNSGFAYVAVSAQSVGVQLGGKALTVWSPTRYGSLDVTNGGQYTHDELAFSIFSQAALAVRNNAGGMLGGLPVRHLIAMGHSQSALWLAVYLNAIQPMDQLYDGALVRSLGQTIRSDLNIPVIKLLTESEFANAGGLNQIPVLQPDADGGPHGAAGFRLWSVAGASHADYWFAHQVRDIRIRDVNVDPLTLNCQYPYYSRIPLHYVENAAYVALVRWIEQSVPPPHAQPIAYYPTPLSEAPVDYGVYVQRDSYGNALGGIRLPDEQVATGLNTGTNSSACVTQGTYIPFTQTQLLSLYPSHQAYVARYAAAALALYKQGFILQPDMNQEVANAQASQVPLAPANEAGIK